MAGLTSGVADLHFFWPSGYGVMELKAGRGKLSAAQSNFRDAILSCGHKWAEIRSLKDAISALTAWGYPLRSRG